MIVELPAEKHTRGIDSGAPYPTLAGWPHSAEDQARRVSATYWWSRDGNTQRSERGRSPLTIGSSVHPAVR
jgi:hypothetical protein